MRNKKNKGMIFWGGENVKGLERLLEKEKLYP